MLLENQFKGFFKNKTVLVTGHTGFQGSWLSLWLKLLGSNVIGYALEPPTQPSLFETLSYTHGMDGAAFTLISYETLHLSPTGAGRPLGAIVLICLHHDFG